MTRKQRLLEWLTKRADDAAVEAQEWLAEEGEVRQAATDLKAGEDVSDFLTGEFEKVYPKRKRKKK